MPSPQAEREGFFPFHIVQCEGSTDPKVYAGVEGAGVLIALAAVAFVLMPSGPYRGSSKPIYIAR